MGALLADLRQCMIRSLDELGIFNETAARGAHPQGFLNAAELGSIATT